MNEPIYRCDSCGWEGDDLDTTQDADEDCCPDCGSFDDVHDIEIPDSRPSSLTPEMKAALDASWERNEAAYRHLGE